MTTNGTATKHLSNGADYGHETTMDKLADQLTGAVIDELCALRYDVDVLKKGGWKVNIGPFQETVQQTQEDRDHFREAITERVKGKLAGVVSTGVEVKKGHSQVNDISLRRDSVADKTVNVTSHAPTEPWKPAYIRSLVPFTSTAFPSSMQTFTWSFLKAFFHGATEYSPGLYYMPRAAGSCILPSRTFYAMSPVHEPFLPSKPCQHGAKLTAFFNPSPPKELGEEAYHDVPLFVASPTVPNSYTYYGTYTQSRWSDKLGYDILAMHVPDAVKSYWARQLADPARPEWVTEQLMKHFFPMPEYEGPMPKSTPNGSAAEEEDEKSAKRLMRKVKEFVEELRLWEIEARSMASLMKEDAIMKAFEESDCEENPGLRLWWEYLECKEWDKGFYDLLVREQDKFKAGR